jgi:hypothetical protein
MPHLKSGGARLSFRKERKKFEAQLMSDLTGANIARMSDLRKAKREWSKRLLKGAALAASARRQITSSSVPGRNVVGVGIGEKVTSGEPTGVMAVKFFVRVKYVASDVPAADRLPKQIAGVPVDVEESGTFRALTALPNPRTKIRPAQPGCSIGFREPTDAFEMAGTFGALVKDNKNLYVLSNNHVLANESQLKPGAPIFQPGLLDGGSTSTGEIARLTKFIPLQPDSNKVDAAIAIVDAASLVKNDVLFIGPPAGTAPAAIDMAVHKFGRTTSYTVGRVTSVATDVTVGYESGNFIFNDQIIIVGASRKSFSQAGDSGSLILERSTQKAVGLLFAGSNTHTIANHIADVLKALGVKMA